MELGVGIVHPLPSVTINSPCIWFWNLDHLEDPFQLLNLVVLTSIRELCQKKGIKNTSFDKLPCGSWQLIYRGDIPG